MFLPQGPWNALLDGSRAAQRTETHAARSRYIIQSWTRPGTTHCTHIGIRGKAHRDTGFRSRSISGAKHARDATLPDFWGTGSPPLLQVPVSGTVYVNHRLTWDAPETGAASFTCENRLAHTVD
jgi:hypothetical protein